MIYSYSETGQHSVKYDHYGTDVNVSLLVRVTSIELNKNVFFTGNRCLCSLGGLIVGFYLVCVF